MSLANVIALVSSINADPSATPDHDEEKVTTTVVKRGAIVEKVEAPIHNPTPAKGVSLPEKGTYDAKSFILACRKARTRDELMQAIAGYCGYDNRRDFGSQEQTARAKAQRELRGAPKTTANVAPSRSLAGFVAGMPQPSHRILLNLQARERATVDAMIAAQTEEERAQHRAMLDTIQKTIAELGF
jgi:hypothetical protein